MTIAAASGSPFALTDQPVAGCNFCVPPADVPAFGFASDFAPMLPADPAVASLGPAQARPATTLPTTEGFIPAATGGGGATALPGAKIAMATAPVDLATTLGLVAVALPAPTTTSPLQRAVAALSFRPAPNAGTPPRSAGAAVAAEMPGAIAGSAAAMPAPPMSSGLIVTISPAPAPTTPEEPQPVAPIDHGSSLSGATRDGAAPLRTKSAATTLSVDPVTTPGQATATSPLPLKAAAPSPMPQPATLPLPTTVVAAPVALAGSTATMFAPPISSGLPGAASPIAVAAFSGPRTGPVVMGAVSEGTPPPAVLLAPMGPAPTGVVSAPDMQVDEGPIDTGQVDDGQVDDGPAPPVTAAPDLSGETSPPATTPTVAAPDRHAAIPSGFSVRTAPQTVADATAAAPDPFSPPRSAPADEPTDDAPVALGEDPDRTVSVAPPPIPDAAVTPPVSPAWPLPQPSPPPPATSDDAAAGSGRGAARMSASGASPAPGRAAAPDGVDAAAAAPSFAAIAPAAVPAAANTQADPRAPGTASPHGDGIAPAPPPLAGMDAPHGHAPTIASDPVPFAAATERASAPPDRSDGLIRTDSAAQAPAPPPTSSSSSPPSPAPAPAAPLFAAPPPPAMAAPGVQATPVAAVPGRVGRELGVTVARHIAVGGGEAMTVRLAPAEMGRIAVRLSFDDDGTLRASVSAEHAVALNLLRRDSAELNRALADAGLKLDGQTLRFETEARSGDGERPGGWSNGSGQNPGHDQGRGSRHPASPYARALADGAGPKADPAYRTLTGSGRVDLMA